MTAIDQHARDEATKALHQIGSHERECALRYAAVEKSFQVGSKRMEALKTGQDRIFAIIIAGGVATISTLFGASVWLASALTEAIAKANGIMMP